MGTGLDSLVEHFQMDELDKLFMESYTAETIGEDFNEDKFLDALDAARIELEQSFFDSLVKSMPSMLEEHIRHESEFVERNKARWKVGIDHLRTLIVVCEESAQAVRSCLIKDPEWEASAKLFALTTLHARSLRLSREILWLIEGGFADGALGRWRTLHELATVSSFLVNNDELVAERYIASRNCAALRAAKQYTKHQVRAKLTPIDEKELGLLTEIEAKSVEKYGKELRSDWGWAHGPIKKPKPTFFDLEEFCRLDHWRPRYKWSSQEIHGAFVPHDKGLGVSENQNGVHLVGPSNSGMTDPASMTAISISLVSANIILLEPNLDRLIAFHCIGKFRDLVGETFLACDSAEAT